MCTTNVSPTPPTAAPSASISMPELSMATCPMGSQSTEKMVAASAAIGRWTSKRSTSVIPHAAMRAAPHVRMKYSRTSTARRAVATSWTHAPAMLGDDRGASDDRRRARRRRLPMAGPQPRLVAPARRVPRSGPMDARARGLDRDRPARTHRHDPPRPRRLTRSSGVHAVGEEHDAVVEPVLVDELEPNADAVGQRGRAAAHHDRVHVDADLVDEARGERVRGEPGPADAEVAVRRIL